MAIVHLTTAIQTSCITPVKTAIDAGSTGGLIDIYTGTIPIDASTAIVAQVKLGTLTFSKPCGTVTTGMLTMSAITSGTAIATGTAAWARLKDSTGATVGDIDVGSSGSGAVLQMNTTNIVNTGPILITSFEFHIG